MTTTPPVGGDNDLLEAQPTDPARIAPVVDGAADPRKLAIAIGAMIAISVVGVLSFGYLKDEDGSKILQVIVAVAIGGGGVWGLYWSADRIVTSLPQRLGKIIQPIVFVGPAMALLAFYLVYPAIETLVKSFQGPDSSRWVGLDNYDRIFTESEYLIGLRNSAIWVILVPAAAVAVGLAFATLADKLGRRTESAVKSLLFLPMAISFVGATVVFTFIYAFRPEGFGSQIGVLNSLWSSVGDPVDWLAQKPWNNLYLMVILIWLQVGFSMVILSSAIKGVPDELIEAARIDGATEWQAFWRIVLPTIASTIVVVWTTVVITVWKVFDIVAVTTNGRDETQVVAQQMVREFFTNRNNGQGAALAVILFIAVVPILLLNIRRFQAEESMR